MDLIHMFASLAEKINQDPAGIAQLDDVYQLELTSGTYQVRLSEGKAEWTEESKWEPTCTLVIKDEVLVKLVTGKLGATTALMMGKLKVKGSVEAALRLQKVLKHYAA
ncbi:SCP2 sterol-binding domain-containing protein [Laceyella putida]|uniref:SCP2 sterol-binding domain-containing protein n=1 Tax=Laceyella putida TaxID=110101 RepID=A0ABW2RKH6_9BACL